jgi:hypothetical protein
MGKSVFISLNLTINTTVAGLSGTCTITGLPVAPKRNVALAGSAGILSIAPGATSGGVLAYNGSNPTMAAGTSFVFSGGYESV